MLSCKAIVPWLNYIIRTFARFLMCLLFSRAIVMVLMVVGGLPCLHPPSLIFFLFLSFLFLPSSYSSSSFSSSSSSFSSLSSSFSSPSYSCSTSYFSLSSSLSSLSFFSFSVFFLHSILPACPSSLGSSSPPLYY